MTVELPVEDILDHNTNIWQVLSQLNVSTLSYARMMNGLTDRGAHVDSNYFETVFKTNVSAICMILEGVFSDSRAPTEDLMRKNVKVSHAYLDAADAENAYENTIGLLRHVVRTWQEA